MMKCILSVCLGLLFVRQVCADVEIIEGVTWYFTVASGSATISSGPIKYSGTLTIPSSLGGFPVTRIASQAFRDCPELESVTIPANVETIGMYAFCNCNGLKSLSIAEGVCDIGMCAFRECSSLETVEIPSSVKTISAYAFMSCNMLKTVVIMHGVEIIDYQAFVDCASLRSVAIPDSVTTIGGAAFCRCSNLRYVTLPPLLKTIESSLFKGCSCLKTMTIPTGVTIIGSSAFDGCAELASLTIPPTIESIGDSAFSGCALLSRVRYLGPPPAKAAQFGFPTQGKKVISRDYAAEWLKVIPISTFGGFVAEGEPFVEVISSEVRDNDPTILDVVYKVTSERPLVGVRVLAFENGNRSLANVVRPETFVEGTDVNVGDAIIPNVEHKISWKVSSDWTTKLAKVKFEVLAKAGGLLPLETMTIPKSDQYGKMTITWSAINVTQVFDALLWLYADKDPGLTLEDGVLMIKDEYTLLAKGSSVYLTNSYVHPLGYTHEYSATGYVLSKMGYSLLTGAPLAYANQETRLGLSPGGVQQYGYKIVE